MYGRYVLGLLFACVLVAQGPLATAAEPADFNGEWDTTWGVLLLEQDGDAVHGTYTYSTAMGSIDGTMSERRLTFRWLESNGTEGDGWFELDAPGARFDGKWTQDGDQAWQPWNGVRVRREAGSNTFEGLFQTTYGRMRLTQAGDGAVSGSYLYSGVNASVKGNAEAGHLTFRYQEPTAKGDGVFDLAADGESFTGTWRADGSSEWKAWSGVRVRPEAGLTWLVIFESQWESSLADNEYSFGEMLRAFFERTPRVHVRQRRIADRADFLRAGAELAYLAEPVVLLVSGHGTEEGVGVSEEKITDVELVAVLEGAPNVFLLHFSSCTVMAGAIPGKVRAALGSAHPLAISGYKVPVDWAASAAFEMLYFDLVLTRRLSPKEAAEVAVSEMPFAGSTPTKGSPLGTMEFEILAP